MTIDAKLCHFLAIGVVRRGDFRLLTSINLEPMLDTDACQCGTCFFPFSARVTCAVILLLQHTRVLGPGSWISPTSSVYGRSGLRLLTRHGFRRCLQRAVWALVTEAVPRHLAKSGTYLYPGCGILCHPWSPH